MHRQGLVTCCPSLSLSLALYLPLSPSLSLSLTHTHTPSLSLCLSVSLTNTHTHTHTFFSRSLSPPPSPPLSLRIAVRCGGEQHGAVIVAKGSVEILAKFENGQLVGQAAATHENRSIRRKLFFFNKNYYANPLPVRPNCVSNFAARF